MWQHNQGKSAKITPAACPSKRKPINVPKGGKSVCVEMSPEKGARSSRRSERSFRVPTLMSLFLGNILSHCHCGQTKKIREKTSRRRQQMSQLFPVFRHFRTLTFILFDRLWATPCRKIPIYPERGFVHVAPQRESLIYATAILDPGCVDAIKGRTQTIYV